MNAMGNKKPVHPAFTTQPRQSRAEVAGLGAATQMSYAQIPRRQVNRMDLKDMVRFIAPDVRDAALKTAAQLNHLGIRYALAGGLAVGAHGYIRATTDVDFLVGEEAFEHQGLLVAFKAGVPIEVGGIRINYLSPTALGA